MGNNNLKSIAFPCISTGIYGFPNEKAVHIALKTVRDWFDKLKSRNQLDSVDRVVFCVFLDIDLRLYETWMQVYFPDCSKTPQQQIVEASDDKMAGKTNSGTSTDAKTEAEVKSSLVTGISAAVSTELSDHDCKTSTSVSVVDIAITIDEKGSLDIVEKDAVEVSAEESNGVSEVTVNNSNQVKKTEVSVQLPLSVLSERLQPMTKSDSTPVDVTLITEDSSESEEPLLPVAVSRRRGLLQGKLPKNSGMELLTKRQKCDMETSSPETLLDEKTLSSEDKQLIEMVKEQYTCPSEVCMVERRQEDEMSDIDLVS
jgi:hypothetical protein